MGEKETPHTHNITERDLLWQQTMKMMHNIRSHYVACTYVVYCKARRSIINLVKENLFTFTDVVSYHFDILFIFFLVKVREPVLIPVKSPTEHNGFQSSRTKGIERCSIFALKISILKS